MSHMRFLNAGEMMAGLMEFGDRGRTFYCMLPLYHGAGGMVVPSVCAGERGGRSCCAASSVNSGFWRDVRRHQHHGDLLYR